MAAKEAPVLWSLCIRLLVLCDSCDLIKGDGRAPSELLSGGTRRFSGGQIRWNNCRIPLCFSQKRALPSSPVGYLFCFQSVPVGTILVAKSNQKLPPVFPDLDSDVSL